MKKGIPSVLAGAASYGILSSLVKLSYKEGYTTAQVVGTQLILGVLILGFFLVLFARNTYSKPTKKQWLPLFFLGLPTMLMSTFYYASIKYMSASLAIVLMFQFSWMGMCLEWFKERRRPRKKELLKISLVLLGTFLASGFIEQENLHISLYGITLGLCSAVCYTVFLFLNKTIGGKTHPLYKGFFMVFGAALLVVFIFPPTYFWDGTFTGGLWKWGLVLALFGMVFPPILLSFGLPRVSLGMGAILSAAELPVAVVMSAFFLQESMSVLRWLGVGLILLALTGSYIFEAFYNLYSSKR